MHAYMHIRVCVCVYKCMYVCVCVHVCAHALCRWHRRIAAQTFQLLHALEHHNHVFLPCCAPFSHYGNFIQQRDAALLLSGYDFLGAAAGLATVGTICSKSLGGAIVQTAGLSGNECLRGHDLLFAVSAWIGFDEIAFFSI